MDRDGGGTVVYQVHKHGRDLLRDDHFHVVRVAAEVAGCRGIVDLPGGIGIGSVTVLRQDIDRRRVAISARRTGRFAVDRALHGTHQGRIIGRVLGAPALAEQEAAVERHAAKSE